LIISRLHENAQIFLVAKKISQITMEKFPKTVSFREDYEDEHHDVEAQSSSSHITPVKQKPKRTNEPLDQYQDMPLSPADTLDTVDTLESGRSPTNHSVVTIEHKIDASDTNKKNGGGGGSSKGMMSILKSPTKMAAGAFFLASTGGAAYFFSQFLTIPGLNNQIKRLEQQVEHLGYEVDRLAEENKRYKGLNDRLNSTVIELEYQNDLLNASNVRYAELNGVLNASIADLGQQNDILEEQVENYAQTNAALNATKNDLSSEVGNLKGEVDRLEIENEDLAEAVTLLFSEVGSLTNTTNDLNTTVIELDKHVGDLTNENNRLETLVNNLETVVSFLGEASTSLQESYEAVSEFLATQITYYRTLVTDTVQNTYIRQLSNWDCAYRGIFAFEDFAEPGNGDMPIGEDKYDDVMKYVDQRVLSKLCLSMSDFELYLENKYVNQGSDRPVEVTTDQLLSAVQLYTLEVFDYYFPDKGDVGGLTEADWAEASYDCEKLPIDRKFFHYSILARNIFH
jgi:regulator of replication initiation timing